MRATDDDMSIINTFPKSVVKDWQDIGVDDDVVLSHGENLVGGGDEMIAIKNKGEWGGLVCVVGLIWVVWRYCFGGRLGGVGGSREAQGYQTIPV
jgi:hypothetical protein